jgi:uncharacterized protein
MRAPPIAFEERTAMTDETPVEVTRIDPKLLELLVCPLTKTSLDYDAERQELISRQAKLAFPIRDGIPIMLPEEARVLTD